MKFADLVPILVAIVAALPALPPLLAILPTFLTSYRKKSSDLSKPASLNVLEVKRIPFTKKYWLEVHKRNRFRAVCQVLCKSAESG